MALRRALFALALLAAPAIGQPARPSLHPPTATVATLPAVSASAAAGFVRLFIITDGASSTDCTVGGGSTRVICWDNGTAWTAVGSGGGGGSGDIESVGDCTTATCFVDGTNRGTQLVYEGATVNANQTILTFTGDPGGAFTVTIPNETGTIVTSGTTAGGALGGTYPNPTVDDDGHAHTGSTISGLDAADTTTGAFADARVDGSLEADEVNPTLGTQTQGNFLASATNGLGIAGASAASEGGTIAPAFKTDDTLAGDPSLGTEECVFTKQGSEAGGFVCEGSVADAHEGAFLFRDVTGADATRVLIDDASTLAGDVDGTPGSLDLDEAAVEAEIESVVDLQDLQGAVTDAQVPDSITVNVGGDLSGTAGSAAVGDDSHAHTGTTLSGIDISDDTNLSGGAGIALSGDAIVTASQEAAFLADGGSTSLTCGSSNQGKAQVLDSGAIEYCDGATTSVLRAGFLDADGTDDDSPDDDSEVPDSITVGAGGSVNDAAIPSGVHRDAETKDGDLVSFDDGNSDFAATDVDEAIEELVSVNGSGPNAADGKVEWSQLVGMPAGFADGTDDGAGGGGDSIEAEDSDNGGSFSAVDTTARFEDSADIDFERVDGGAGGPDAITGTVRANSIALTTDTTGNYAAGDGEAGAALTGDSATAFFSAGTLEDARIDGSAEADEVNPTLGSQTQGNYVDDVTAGIGIAVTHTPGEGSDAAVALSFADAGTDPVLGAAGCTFSSEGASAAGLVCEGDTNDAHEARVRFTDPTADRIITIPDADSTTVQPDTGASNNFLTAISAAGVVSKAQPAFSNLSGTASDAQVPDNVTLALESASLTAILDDEVLVGTGAAAGAFTALQNCDDTTGKLDWTGTAFACVTDQTGAGGGDAITVNTTAATDANLKDSATVTFSLDTGASPDDVTATAIDVTCTGCLSATELASDSVAEPELKAVDSPNDEEVLTYEATAGDFEWQRIESIFMGVGSSISASALRYISIDGPSVANATEAIVVELLPVAITPTRFACSSSAAPNNGGGTQDYTMVLRDDVADSDWSCVISEAATSCSDTSGSAVAVDSLIAVSVTPSGSPTTVGIRCSLAYYSG